MKNLPQPVRFLILVLGIPLLAYFPIRYWFSHARKLPVYRTLDAAMLAPPAPDASGQAAVLLNQDGHAFSLDSLKGRISVVEFFFSSCISQCPKMNRAMKTLSETFALDPKVQLLSFTVDPEHDTPARLKSYAELMGFVSPRWYFITGTKAWIYRLARQAFGIVALDAPAASNDFIHSPQWTLLDARGRIRGYYSGVSSNDHHQIVLDIQKLEHEN